MVVARGMKVKPTRRRFLWPFIFLLLASLLPAPAEANGPKQVGLVIDYGDGSVGTFCVEFSEDSISGREVLERAGRQLELGFGGGTVCKIDGVGCPGDNCWCNCQDPSAGCIYWIYWHLVGGGWEYSGGGAAGYQVRDGDVEGWAWGSGSIGSGGVQPPVYTIEQICQPPTPTHTPANTSTPTVTNTLSPTDTPGPTNTPEISFRADATELTAGSCTTLRWDVENVQEVYLDGQPQQGHGSKQVCPATSETHELRVVSGGGENRYQVSLTVAPAARSQEAAPTATPQPKAAPGAPAATPPAALTDTSAPPTSTPTPDLQPPASNTPTTVPPTTTPAPTSTTAISRAGPTTQAWATRRPREKAAAAPKPGFSLNSTVFLLFGIGAMAGAGLLAVVFALSWWWTKQDS
jgi:hypothetical protein